VAIYNASYGLITISEADGSIPTLVTSECSDTSYGTIYLANSGASISARLIIQGGTVSNTNDDWFMKTIRNDSAGAVYISGGEVRGYEYAIWNNSTGAVNISGGAVTSINYSSIYNNSSGSVNISGGTVSATDGVAIYNGSTGLITISEADSGAPTLVTSACSDKDYGTIYLADYGTSADARLIIEGGKVENTCASSLARTVYNGSTGSVNVTGGEVSITGPYCCAIISANTGSINVSGGMVSAPSGYPLGSLSTGSINVSGGTVSTTTGYAIYNDAGGSVNITGGNIGATATSGRAIYNRLSGTVNVSGGNISATSGWAIYNDSTGAVNVSGGNISATSGWAIYNRSSGVVNISGGEIRATTGMAIYNGWTGSVTVSGGTVSATDGQAIWNNSTGTINISEADPDVPTLVTSANTSATSGTIHLFNAGGAVYISGGMANNTAGGNVIYPLQPLLTNGDNVHITVVPEALATAGVTKAFNGAPSTLAPAFKGLIVITKAQWYKDNEPIDGATSMTLAVTEIEDSGVYVLKVWYWADGAESAVPVEATMNVSITLKVNTLTFNSNGGSAVSAQTSSMKTPADSLRPEDPTKDGYTFGGWFTDNGTFAVPFLFGEPIDDDITIFAKWTIVGGNTGGSEGDGGGLPIVLIVVIIAVIAAAGFAAYWFLLRKKP